MRERIARNGSFACVFTTAVSSLVRMFVLALLFLSCTQERWVVVSPEALPCLQRCRVERMRCLARDGFQRDERLDCAAAARRCRAQCPGTAVLRR